MVHFSTIKHRHATQLGNLCGGGVPAGDVGSGVGGDVEGDVSGGVGGDVSRGVSLCVGHFLSSL